MKIAIVDTAYPAFLNSLPPLTGSYDEELRKYLDLGFGTADFYSHYLTQEGHECIDIIGNSEALQGLWARERHLNGFAQDIAMEQIRQFRPDVVFLQDLSFFSDNDIRELRAEYFIAAQCSCRISDEKLKRCDLVFTSFPFYVDRILSLGVQAHYLPLAFDPRMLSEASQRRTLDIVFIGGVGKRSHWKAGTETLEAVADAFKERFHWFGYGRENLESGSPLIPCYGGPAWGRAMYDCYGRAKIVMSRHGEVAEGYTNNLRCFEATGMGALLLTEQSDNLKQLFPSGVIGYSSSDDAIEKISLYLSEKEMCESLAKNAQQYTLAHHNYQIRMREVSDVLIQSLALV